MATSRMSTTSEIWICDRTQRTSDTEKLRYQTVSLPSRSGGLSAFRTDELESLQKVYQRLTFLDPALLEKACVQAQQRSIVEIVFLLQRLHDERRT